MAIHRTRITVEVLTDGPYDPDSLSSVAHDIDQGDASGRWFVQDIEKLTNRSAALSLLAQGSDPEFLLGEDGWKYALCQGDCVTVKPPGRPSERITIQETFFHSDDLVFIKDTHGHKFEVTLDEITEKH